MGGGLDAPTPDVTRVLGAAVAFANDTVEVLHMVQCNSSIRIDIFVHLCGVHDASTRIHVITASSPESFPESWV